MQCWCFGCGEDKDIKHFTEEGVFYYEHCNSCRQEDLFGPNEESQNKLPRKSGNKTGTPKIKEETKLQKIKRQFITYNNKIKLDIN